MVHGMRASLHTFISHQVGVNSFQSKKKKKKKLLILYYVKAYVGEASNKRNIIVNSNAHQLAALHFTHKMFQAR